MEQAPQNIAGFFARVFASIVSGFKTYIPPGTGMLLLFVSVIGLIVGVVFYLKNQKSESQIRSDQNTDFGAAYDMLAQGRKGLGDYLALQDVRQSQSNWVLFNFAPLTVSDAGYLGPGTDGLYDTQAIRRALDMGFRGFSFNIDYYSGAPKDQNLFVGPGEPCLLHRDDQGVIRSRNCGRIDEMMTALAQQAFSRSLPNGSDPLIVMLNFKNVPDRVKNQGEYITFLKRVSEKIQPLAPTFLDRLGETAFAGMSNPSLLFTQNFQALQNKTIIFTNINTDVFTQESTRNTPMAQNLRHWIHAQIFSLSSDTLPNDQVTEIQPKGTLMSTGMQDAMYFLNTPPDKIQDAQLKTNNVYTVVNPPEANKNLPLSDIETLMNKYGVQIIPFNLFVTPQETEAYFKYWGPYSWRLKPKNLQYVVVRAEPPKPISPRANANGGNVSPPALHF